MHVRAVFVMKNTRVREIVSLINRAVEGKTYRNDCECITSDSSLTRLVDILKVNFYIRFMGRDSQSSSVSRITDASGGLVKKMRALGLLITLRYKLEQCRCSICHIASTACKTQG
jgi:hypothetical protein